MGKVIVRAKIYVENPNEIKNIEGKIKEIVEVGESNVEELGFGIKILKIAMLLEESEGIEKIEEKIKNIDGIKQVEIGSVDRAF